jgi:hypothetical protein
MEIFRDLAQAFKFDSAVETGSYRGDTTGVIAREIRGRVDTIESCPWNAGFVRGRYLFYPEIRTVMGDSRACLRRLLTDNRYRCGNHFFYLDAHWGEDLPLAEELELIFGSGINAVAMIDDFEVPGDDGYGYDDYGAGRKLSMEYVGPVVLRYDLCTFFPIEASRNETGARRGSAIVVPSGMADRVRAISSVTAVEHCDVRKSNRCRKGSRVL